jgi:hypothetical protein
MYARPSQAPPCACTRVSALWWEKDPLTRQFTGGRMCTPPNPAWVRKQSKRDWHGTTHTPRLYATYVWCAHPLADVDWSLHYMGRKGTGPYRNPNPCAPVLPWTRTIEGRYYTGHPSSPTWIAEPLACWREGSATCAGTPPRPTHP